MAQLRDAESRLVTMFRPGSAPPRTKDVAAVRAEIETLRRAAEEDALGPQMKAEALFKMLSQLKSENAALKARACTQTSLTPAALSAKGLALRCSLPLSVPSCPRFRRSAAHAPPCRRRR